MIQISTLLAEKRNDGHGENRTSDQREIFEKLEKSSALNSVENEELLVDENEAIEITGITQSRISTICTVDIRLMKSKITFHVVHSDFTISTDGILGREYLRQEKVEISFWHNTIVTHSIATKPIPFIDNVSRLG